MRFLRRKPVPLLSSGEVASAFGVSRAIVGRWADAGELPAHRLPTMPGKPGPGERRFRIEDVRAFALKHGLPCDLGGLSILACTQDQDVLAALASAHGATIEKASSAADLGWLAGVRKPGFVVLDRVILSAWEVSETAAVLRRRLPGVRLAVLLVEDDDESAMPCGLGLFRRPWTADELVRLADRAAEG